VSYRGRGLGVALKPASTTVMARGAVATKASARSSGGLAPGSGGPGLAPGTTGPSVTESAAAWTGRTGPTLTESTRREATTPARAPTAPPVRSGAEAVFEEAARRGPSAPVIYVPDACVDARLEHAPSYSAPPRELPPGSMVVWGVQLPEGLSKSKGDAIARFIRRRLNPKLKEVTTRTNPTGIGSCNEDMRNRPVEAAVSHKECYRGLREVQRETPAPHKWLRRSILTLYRARGTTVEYVPDMRLLVVRVMIKHGWEPVNPEKLSAESGGMSGREVPFSLGAGVAQAPGSTVEKGHPPLASYIPGSISAALRAEGIPASAVTIPVPVYVPAEEREGRDVTTLTRIMALHATDLWRDFAVVMGRWFTRAVEMLPQIAIAKGGVQGREKIAAAVEVLSRYDSIASSVVSRAESAASSMSPQEASAVIASLRSELNEAERKVSRGMGVRMAASFEHDAQNLKPKYERFVRTYVRHLRTTDPVRRQFAECHAIKLANEDMARMHGVYMGLAREMAALEAERDRLASNIPAMQDAFARARARLDEIEASLDLGWYEKKVGGLPVWAWGLLGAAGVGGGIWYLRRKK